MAKVKLALVDNLIWVILVGIIFVFGILLGDVFLNLNSLRFTFFSSAKLGCLVLAEGLCLLSGNFDLSVGQMAGFTAMFTAMAITGWFPWIPWYLGILIILLIGAACGALNGFFIGKMGINPFLMTLGTYLMFMGATLMISLHPIRKGFPRGYLAIGSENVFGIPIAIIVFLVCAVMLYVILNHTHFGSNVLAVGGNPEAASRVGINVGNVTFWVFVLSGVLSGVSGLLYSGFISSATPGLAEGTLFMAFAGAVIGGTSLAGGRGSVLGMLGGTLLIGTIEGGLTMLRIGPQQLRVAFGGVVIIAILINRTRERIRDRILMPG